MNVQPLIADANQPGLLGAAEAALDLRTGNTQLLLLSGSLLGRYRTGRHLVFLLARKEFGKQGGERFSNKDFEHLRYRYAVLERLEAELFAQHDQDEFRRLAVRLLAGAGPRVTLIATDEFNGAAGLAYMLEYEQLDDGPYADSGDETLDHRLSGYLTGGLQLDDRLHFAQSVYAQPRIDQPDDLRVLGETELAVALDQHFSLKLTFSLAYDSRPPDGRRGLDTGTKTSLQLRF